MDVVEAAAILGSRLEEAAARGYDPLAQLASVSGEDRTEVRGGSGAMYQLEILYLWDSRPGGAVRVMGSIDDGGLRAFVPLTKSVLVGPAASAVSATGEPGQHG